MSGRARLMTWLTLIAAFGLALASCGTALAQEDDEQAQAGGDMSKMYLDVGNPSSSDSIHVGAYTMEGIAFDGAAEAAPGIDHIDIFLDDRNTGGTLIGHAQMFAASPEPDDPALQGAGWTADVVIPRKLKGAHVLFVYALSSATGDEMVVGIPVEVVP